MTFVTFLIGTRTNAVKQRVWWSTAAALVFVLLAAGTSDAGAALKTGDRVGELTAEQAAAVASDFPGLTMPAGILSAPDGRILWSRSPDSRRAMASITKIMTAVVAIDRLALDDTATVPARALRVGESEADLKRNEVLTVEDLLEALLVKSGNDAAVTLAERVAGSEDEFVKLMNEEAQRLGLANTHFTNAHGLDEEGHHTTAADLAVLSRYAMTKPAFRQYVGSKTAKIGTGSSARTLEASNKLIGSYPGATGVKTGWTSDAGYSLVASAMRDGVELTAVILGTTREATRFAEARKLLDWGFEHYRPQKVAGAGSPAGEVAVTDYVDRVVPATVSTDTTAVVFDLDGPIERRTRLLPGVKAPVERGQQVGTLALRQGDRLVATVPLVAAEAVPRPGFFERLSIGIRRTWLRLTGKPTVAESTALS